MSLRRVIVDAASLSSACVRRPDSGGIGET
jgi:hypothetical protein